MASIAFAAIGSAFGPVGTAFGAAIGSIVDQFLVAYLFPNDPIDGTRIYDLPASASAEGTPLMWGLGTHNRTGCPVIWKQPTDPPYDERVKVRKIGSGFGPKQEIRDYSYFVSCALHVTDVAYTKREHFLKRLYANNEVIYDAESDVGNEYYTSIRIYTGNQTEPDDLIESYEGSQAQAYIDSMVIVLEEFNMTKFGNNWPTFSAEWGESYDVSLQDAIDHVMQRLGYSTDDYDLTQLPQCFTGMPVSGVQQGTRIIAQMILAHALSIIHDEGKIVFVPRGVENIIQIVEDDLGARAGRSGPEIVGFGTVSDSKIPRGFLTRYASLENNFEQGGKFFARDSGTEENAKVISLGMALYDNAAMSISTRAAWAAEAERDIRQLTLPPEYIELSAGQVIQFRYDDDDYVMFVKSLARGANFEVRVDGYSYVQSVYEQALLTASGNGPSVVYTPPETTGLILDLPALHSTHVGKIGSYYAVAATDQTTAWRGAYLYVSKSGSSGPFEEEELLIAEMVYGVTVLGPVDGPHLFTDQGTRIQLTLKSGTLTSVTDEEFYAGHNLVAIQTTTGEWEIIAYRDVTVINEEQSLYELSHLLRGLRGTETLTDKHELSAANCVFFNFDDIGLRYFEDVSSAFGVTRHFKFPSAGGSLADFDVVEHQYTGQQAKPFAPANLELSYDSSDNLNITWQRRSKTLDQPYSGLEGALSSDESPETYLVEVFETQFGSAEVKVFEEEVTTSSYQYTAAAQTSDGYTAGAGRFAVKVSQISQLVGAGYAAEAFIIP